MSFATGVIGGSGTNVWKPDPTLTPGVDGDPFAPFELGLTVTLDDRSFQVAQFCRIGAAGLLIDDTAAIVDGVTTTATEENFWTNKTGVDLVEGDYAFLFGTIINGAAGGGGGGTVGPATTNQVAYFTGVTAVGGDAGFTYNSGTDTATLVTALDVPLVTHTVTGGNADCLTTATAVTSGNADASTTATATTGNANANNTAVASTGDASAVITATCGNGDAYSYFEANVLGDGNAFGDHRAFVDGNGDATLVNFARALGEGTSEASSMAQATTGDATCTIVATTTTGLASTGISATAGAHHVGVSGSATDGGTMLLVVDTGDDIGDANDVLVSNGTRALWSSVVFPDADPHIAGAGYWVAGVLTKSAG